jgi:hypothetical protein
LFVLESVEKRGGADFGGESKADLTNRFKGMEDVVAAGLVERLEGCGKRVDEGIVGVMESYKSMLDEALKQDGGHTQLDNATVMRDFDYKQVEDEVRKVVRGEIDRAVGETKGRILDLLKGIVQRDCCALQGVWSF